MVRMNDDDDGDGGAGAGENSLMAMDKAQRRRSMIDPQAASKARNMALMQSSPDGKNQAGGLSPNPKNTTGGANSSSSGNLKMSSDDAGEYINVDYSSISSAMEDPEASAAAAQQAEQATAKRTSLLKRRKSSYM